MAVQVLAQLPRPARFGHVFHSAISTLKRRRITLPSSGVIYNIRVHDRLRQVGWRHRTICRMPNMECRDVHRLPADLPASSRLWRGCFRAPQDGPVTVGVSGAEATCTRWVITSLQRVQCSRLTFQEDLQFTTHDMQSPVLTLYPSEANGVALTSHTYTLSATAAANNVVWTRYWTGASSLALVACTCIWDCIR